MLDLFGIFRHNHQFFIFTFITKRGNTADPHTHPEAQLISHIAEVSQSVEALGGGRASNQGTGGMATKLKAAKMCMDAGCEMVICNGAEPDNLYAVVEGRPVGTRFSKE